jgi:redox-sensing transcriptional repressor
MIRKKQIKRLLLYRLCLIRFKELGFKKVFSHTLGSEAGVSAELVRKDFSQYNLPGNKKAGYNIDSLLIALNEKFVLNEVRNVILVGMGNMGKAIANYNHHYIGTNVYIVAAFDIDPSKQNRKFGMPVFSLDKLSAVIQGFKVNTAIIATPAISAQNVCNQLVENGIKGIMNLAPISLKAPKDVLVSNVNLSSEIETIIYRLNGAKDIKDDE